MSLHVIEHVVDDHVLPEMHGACVNIMADLLRNERTDLSNRPAVVAILSILFLPAFVEQFADHAIVEAQRPIPLTNLEIAKLYGLDKRRA